MKDFYLKKITGRVRKYYLSAPYSALHPSKKILSIFWQRGEENGKKDTSLNLNLDFFVGTLDFLPGIFLAKA